MKVTGKLQVTLPSDREIAMVREFDAPLPLLWEAHTKPELLKQWLGVVNGMVLETCEVDLRPGGAYRYVWKHPGGFSMGMGGTYQEIVPQQKIVATEKFDESWYEGEALDTITFAEHGGKTTVTTNVRYASRDVRDAVLKTPMDEGMAAGFDVLEALLPKLSARR